MHEAADERDFHTQSPPREDPPSPPVPFPSLAPASTQPPTAGAAAAALVIGYDMGSTARKREKEEEKKSVEAFGCGECRLFLWLNLTPPPAAVTVATSA